MTNLLRLHPVAITCLEVWKNFLLTGDQQGAIKVYQTSDMSVLLQGNVQPTLKPHDMAITSLAVLEHPNLGQPVVAAGNKGGYITLVQ